MKEVFQVKRSNDGDDVLKSVNGIFANVIAVNADKTLKDTDSGSFVTLSSTGGAVAVTLPTILQSGLYYNFAVLEDTPTAAITIAAGSAIIFGNFHEAEVDTSNDGPGSSGATGVSNVIIGTSSKKGDRFGLLCDGINWYLTHAQVQIDGSITTT